MKAVVYHEYGSADVLRYEEVEKPSPGDNEVRVKIRAASLNPLDWRVMHGEPKALRFVAKLMKMGGRPGVDMSGEVEAAGKDVKEFKPGDKVFGGCRGALAEYACTKEANIVAKPENVTFEQAASVYVAGLTALQALRDKGGVQPDQRVLINGASGGVGTFAVQIGKLLGVHVTGICSTKNIDLVRSIGADEVIDYTKQDFTKSGLTYDVVLDNVGNHPFSAVKQALNSRGTCVVIGAPHDISIAELLALPFRVLGASMFSSRKIKTIVGKANRDDLTRIGEWIAAGQLTPVIEKRYSLRDAAEAMRHLETGHARGKVVVTVDV